MDEDIYALHLIHFNFEKIKHYLTQELINQTEFIRKEFGLPMFYPHFIVRKRGRNCWGGTRIINGNVMAHVNIAVTTLLEMKDVEHREYSDIAHDPQIGSFEGPWQKSAACLLAHELAHAIHKTMPTDKLYVWLRNHNQYYKNINCSVKGHNSTWQTIYCFLREHLVNNYKIKQYEKIFNKVKKIPVSGLGRNVLLFAKGPELHAWVDLKRVA